MSTTEQLLLLQEHDTKSDQLRYRKEHLEERGKVEELSAGHAKLLANHTALAERRAELERHQRRIEDELASLQDKKSQSETALYSGSVKNPRELQALQEEIDSLKKRESAFEDELLDILAAIEPLDEQLNAAADEVSASQDALTEAENQLSIQEAEIDVVLADVMVLRDETAARLSESQLQEYESRRRQLGGIAVARLVGNSCGGCHLQLSAVQLDRIRKMPHDELADCDECGRLLVH
ncbi:MAG: C4-type zinc ribbon domain-containing protein [Acidimicrobiia bacterium]